jgi:hypothetical protein
MASSEFAGQSSADHDTTTAKWIIKLRKQFDQVAANEGKILEAYAGRGKRTGEPLTNPLRLCIGMAFRELSRSPC